MSEDDKTTGPRAIPNPERDEVRAVIERQRRMSAQFLEICELAASQRWQQFQAYRKAGFNEAQSLDLVRAELERGRK